VIDFLPTLNAVLNSTAAVLLLLGRRFIARGNRGAHRRAMIGTFTVSVLFLISYLTYHSFHLTTHFQGQGWIRPVYFAILVTHTICAAAIVPLSVITLRRGLALSVEAHRRIARWTFPIWLYVSLTGVIVYLLLYHLYPA
jgi:putative membrane protein